MSNKHWMGELLAVHEIKHYKFLEVKTPEDNTYFDIHIDNESINIYASSIEEAMAIAISYYFEKSYTSAAYYFINMIRGSSSNSKKQRINV